jgi:hypothetical protein
MSDEIRVNGNLHSWGSIKIKVAGDLYTGFTAISYSDSRERVKGHGMGRHHAPRGRSRGKYNTEPVQLTGYKGSLQQLRKALADAGDGVSYGDTEFQIIVQYVESDDTPITVELDRCVWTKNASSEEENPDPLKEDVEFDCMLIRRNNLVLFDNSEANI